MVIEELAGIGERFEDDERNRDKQKAHKPVIDEPKDYGAFFSNECHKMDRSLLNLRPNAASERRVED